VSIAAAVRGKEERVWNGGGMITGCVDAACETVATVGAGVLTFPGTISGSSDMLAKYGTVNLSTGTAKHRLQTEALVVVDDGDDSMQFLFAGYRYAGTSFGLDLGLAGAVEHGDLEGVLPMVGLVGRL
jgi:hypothetical protein